jgi:hypothetical protein
MKNNIEAISKKIRPELSDKTIDDFIGAEYTEAERKEILDSVVKRIIEKEKDLTEDFLAQNILNLIKPEKKQEFTELESGFRTSLIARYLIFEELSAEEKEYVLTQGQSNQALKNLVDFHQEASKYFI